MKRLIVVVLLILLLPQSALAAKPSTATLSAPAVVQSGDTFQVTGTGYVPGSIVYVNEGNPGCCVAYAVRADSAGNIAFTPRGSTTFTGTWVFRTILDDNHKRLVRLAEIFVEVVP